MGKRNYRAQGNLKGYFENDNPAYTRMDVIVETPIEYSHLTGLIDLYGHPIIYVEEPFLTGFYHHDKYIK